MEALTTELIVDDKSSSYKIVPWISWDDWEFVRNSLFSSSPDSIAIALRRIFAWRSRGRVPVSVDVTASIIEIQQKDSFFRNDLNEESLLSDELLAMLYCMSITRLVNGIIEKTRKKNEISIGAAADAIGLPRMLVDVRHDGSHRDLPSLQLVQLASITALEFLKSYYWETQQSAILSERTRNIPDEVKSSLRNLASSLKIKSTQAVGSTVKAKRVGQHESISGRNKLPSLLAAKIQSSNPAGSKKHIKKLLKNIIRLYSFFSSEVVSVLLEFLLKEFNSLDSTQNSEVKGIWRRVIIKLSNKEPQLLFGLVDAFLNTVELQETAIFVSGAEQKNSGLSNLLEWLVSNVTKLKEGSNISESHDSSVNLTKLLHKCLLVSPSDNNILTSMAVVLAGLTKNTLLTEKLTKLAAMRSSTTDIHVDTNKEETIRRAAEKLEKLKRMKDCVDPIQCRWSVARRWQACPIGMLPRDIGSSGLLPILERKNEVTVEKGKTEILSKREAEVCVEDLNDTAMFKKVKKSEIYDDVVESVGGVEGKLMIGGILRGVSEDEVSAIASSIRVFV